jgi:hypothetical protein
MKVDLFGFKRPEKHGMNKTQEYRAWVNMRQRCYNQNNTKYDDYGARGIKVCDRWFHSFKNFLADMGYKPSPEYSLDRRNNDGNYEPKNCRWATRKVQRNNARKQEAYRIKKTWGAPNFPDLFA